MKWNLNLNKWYPEIPWTFLAIVINILTKLKKKTSTISEKKQIYKWNSWKEINNEQFNLFNNLFTGKYIITDI